MWRVSANMDEYVSKHVCVSPHGYVLTRYGSRCLQACPLSHHIRITHHHLFTPWTGAALRSAIEAKQLVTSLFQVPDHPPHPLSFTRDGAGGRHDSDTSITRRTSRARAGLTGA